MTEQEREFQALLHQQWTAFTAQGFIFEAGLMWNTLLSQVLPASCVRQDARGSLWFRSPRQRVSLAMLRDMAHAETPPNQNEREYLSGLKETVERLLRMRTEELEALQVLHALKRE